MGWWRRTARASRSGTLPLIVSPAGGQCKAAAFSGPLRGKGLDPRAMTGNHCPARVRR
jgi:hypothetical protein